MKVISDLFVGGSRNGQRTAPTDEWRSFLPLPPLLPHPIGYVSKDDPILSVTTIEVERYALRSFQFCWDSILVYYWVLESLNDGTARALIMEWL